MTPLYALLAFMAFVLFVAFGCVAMIGALATPIYQHEKDNADACMLGGVVGMIVFGLVLGGCVEHMLP